MLLQAKASSAKLPEAQIGLHTIQDAKTEGAEEERVRRALPLLLLTVTSCGAQPCLKICNATCREGCVLEHAWRRAGVNARANALRPLPPHRLPTHVSQQPGYTCSR